MTLSAQSLQGKSDAEIRNLLTSSEQELATKQAEVKRLQEEAGEVLKKREAHARWERQIKEFTSDLLKGAKLITKGQSRVKVGIDSYIDQSFVNQTPGFKQIMDAISEKFNVTIEIVYDDGGSDAGGWGSPMPSSKAILTAGREKEAGAEAENAIIQALLKKIEVA